MFQKLHQYAVEENHKWKYVNDIVNMSFCIASLNAG